MERRPQLRSTILVALNGWLWCAVALAQPSSMDDFVKLEKIDVHTHIHSLNGDFVALAARDNFRFVNMAVWSGTPEKNREKHRTMYLQAAAEPQRVAAVCSFPLENWDEPNFVQDTLAYLDQQVDKGCVGVKVWKNIGMELRDRQGNLVMIDNPKFDPIFEHIAKRKLVLLGHLGEPKNCWLPLDQMTTLNDRSYFEEHPQYHMHLHPELPSYEEQIAARNAMLAKHPQLTFVACHLASLEWSVEEIAKFLDRFPNAVVEIAARTGQLQYQSQRDPAAVAEFFVEYQDRILYGTDLGIGPDSNAVEEYEKAKSRWLRDWRYFNTDETFDVPELPEPVRGLNLDRSVVRKLYSENARRVFDTSW